MNNSVVIEHHPEIYGFEKSPNITYVRQEVDQDLHLYLPTGGPTAGKKFPLVVMVHSGAFITGSKDNHIITSYCRDLAERGYITASVNYRDILEQRNLNYNKIHFTTVFGMLMQQWSIS